MPDSPINSALDNPLVKSAARKVETAAAAASAEPAEQCPMTDWYNPGQLLDTAKKTVISTIIGENADPRIVTAARADGGFFDYSKEFAAGVEFVAGGSEREELWLDYVSDVGDGWNPTYSVAYALAQEKLVLPTENLRIEDPEELKTLSGGLRRGEILIFGGDGVSPTAHADEYAKKLVAPYCMAFNASRRAADDARAASDLSQNPHVFVLPGNHDWYDSLVSFQNLFCTHIFNRRKFAGGWRTRQQRSYFTLKLPHGWWLLGVDLQLSHNIDARQLEYFESIVEKMSAGDRVILCVPEPFWVKAIKYQGFAEAEKKFEKKEQSIERLELLLAEKFPENPIEIKLYIAGDLHHYRRFESEDGRKIQKITSGGGGAFLHPTHDFDFAAASAGEVKSARYFTVRAQYPDPEISKNLDWKNLYGFIAASPYFGFLTAALYILLAWLIQGELIGRYDWTTPFKVTLVRAIENPLPTLTVILMMAGLIFFTDSSSKRQKYVGGFLHALAHLGAIFALGWLSFFVMLWVIGENTFDYETVRNNQPTLVNLIWLLCLFLICGIGGYVIGSFIMGVYLFVSLHLFGRHDNEAFSALKIEDYKNFLRMHITRDKLTIYPVKIEKVGRRWNYKTENGGVYEPDAPLKPELAEEKPIVIR